MININYGIQKTLRCGLPVIGFIAISCSRILPCNSHSGLTRMEVQPKPDELEGHYTPDTKTIDLFKAYEHIENMSLEVHQNGSFKINNILAGILDTDSYYNGDIAQEIDVKGSWKVVTHENSVFMVVDLHFNKEQADIENYGTSWQLFTKDEKPVILIPVGDPDECMVARFVKL